MSDPINPAHYQFGQFEAIQVIEHAVGRAPDAVVGGCQWNALKYLLRMWSKGKPLEDARKSLWYLTRLVEHLERQ